MKALRLVFILLTLAGVAALVWGLWERARMEEVRRKLTKLYSGSNPIAPQFQHPSLADLAELPTVTAWTYPMGSERGAMIYNAQPFGTTRHLGEDLNGIGGENSDLGDPVYCVGDGLVIYAEDLEGGWGKVVIVLHAFAPEAGTPRRYIQSYYAHLGEFHVRAGQHVSQQEVIGTVGNADGQYLAHLHFEMRELLNAYIGAGYRVEPPRGWLSPEALLRENLATGEDVIQREITPLALEQLESGVDQGSPP